MNDRPHSCCGASKDVLHVPFVSENPVRPAFVILTARKDLRLFERLFRECNLAVSLRGAFQGGRSKQHPAFVNEMLGFCTD